MPEFKRSYLVAFLLGLAVCALQIARPGLFFNASALKENSRTESGVDSLNVTQKIVSGLHPIHEAQMEKNVLNNQVTGHSEVTNHDIAESSQKLYSERALSSRDQWDNIKTKNPEIILYFMDRYPREIAEEIVNAFR